MKKIILTGFAILTVALSFTSCRDTEEKTEAEVLVEEMQEEGADIKIKKDGDGDMKIKMETDDKEVKIKEEEDGDQKIKITTDNDDN